MTIVSEAYTINVVLTLAAALASVINYDRKWHSIGLCCKSFTIIIYDRNDSGQYYKTMITIVIYDSSLS